MKTAAREAIPCGFVASVLTLTSMIWFYVAFGGALGAMARYGASLGAMRLLGGAWPYGTFGVNIIGGLAMGALTVWLAMRDGNSQALRLFLGVGLLGGFTTFSAFSLETLQMIERKAFVSAAAYAIGSVAACVIAVFVGIMITRKALA